jgi:PAS domain S-box-containing protein
MNERENSSRHQPAPPDAPLEYGPPESPGQDPDEARGLVDRVERLQAELQDGRNELQRCRQEAESLRQRDARLYEQIPVACLTLDGQCRILETNAAARTMFLMSESSLVGKSLASLVHDEGRDAFVACCARAMQDLERFNCETEFEIEAGRKFSAAVEGVGLRDAQGGSGTLVVTVTDVTERRRAEALIQQNHERLRMMFELSRDGIVIFDKDMLFRQANPAACSIFGYVGETLLQMRVADLPPVPERPGALEQLSNIPESDAKTGEFNFVRSDGEQRTVEYSARQFSDGQYVAFLRDITDERMAAEQLLHYSEHLEDLVELRAERIRELERNRVQSEQLASTGRMAARIAHEINNPLAGIKNSFLLVKDAVPVDYPYYRYVGAIEKEIDRIARIVSQMFDLYQPEQEQPQRFNLGETVEDVILMLEPMSRQRGVTVNVRMPDFPLIVFQPEGLVRQVLYNLISNAIEASPPEESVRVSTVPLAENVSIAVADHGRGISEEVASHLFEPFFTTKRAGAEEGVGLGLSVSRTLVELMGGSLSYQSKVGEGTVFRMVLPQTVTP